MKHILVILLFTYFVISCSTNNIKSKPKDKHYIIDVVYVYDEALPTFDSSTFLYLFKYRIPYLTKQILGYDVLLNVKTGTTEKEFYNATKRVLRTNLTMLSESHINLFDTTYDELENAFYNSLSKEHPFRLGYLFATTNINTIVEKYLKKNIQNILSIYNMKLSKREKLFQNEYPLVNRSFYWAMIASSYRSADMIVINMPIVSLDNQMDVKGIADYGFVDRVVAKNRERSMGVSSVVTTYPLISNDSFFASIGGNIDTNSQIEIFSYYMVQTIGMMLGGYDLLENEPSSIMNEVIDFEYKTWYDSIKNTDNLVAPYKLLRKYPYSNKD